MKLLSLSHFWEMFRTPAQRFPLSVLFSFMFAFLAIYINHLDYLFQEDWTPALISFGFGFLLSVAVDLYMESKKFEDAKKSIGRIGVLAAVGVAYWFLFKDFTDWLGWQAITALLLFITVWIGVYIGPFFIRDKFLGFWNHGISFTGRILLSLVFYGVLFGGIAMLMASVDFLFDVNIDGEYYLDVWLVLAGVLAPMYVLSGMPENWSALEKKKYYPKAIKFLAQYLLVPLVFAYFIVLYLYTGRIVFSWNWPNGDVANWIIVFSAVGVLAYALTAKGEEFLPYVAPFRKWFFFALIPQILVLFMAIGIRIGQYGITEPRYFVVLAGLWLMFVALYFLFSKIKDLKMLAFSLLTIALLSNFGPWSATSVSSWNQMGRLENLLIENSLIVDGKVVQGDSMDLEQNAYDNIVSAVRYLVDIHGTEGLADWFDEDLNDLGDNQRGKGGWYYSADSIVGLMLTGERQSNEPGEYRSVYNIDFCGREGCVIDMRDYDYLIDIYSWQNNSDFEDIKFSMAVDGSNLIFSTNGNEDILDISELYKLSSARAEVSSDVMIFKVSTPELDGELELQNASFGSSYQKEIGGRLKFNLK